MARDNLAIAIVEYGLCLFYATISIVKALSDIVMAYLRHRRGRRYG